MVRVYQKSHGVRQRPRRGPRAAFSKRGVVRVFQEQYTDVQKVSRRKRREKPGYARRACSCDGRSTRSPSSVDSRSECVLSCVSCAPFPARRTHHAASSPRTPTTAATATTAAACAPASPTLGGLGGERDGWLGGELGVDGLHQTTPHMASARSETRLAPAGALDPADMQSRRAVARRCGRLDDVCSSVCEATHGRGAQVRSRPRDVQVEVESTEDPVRLGLLLVDGEGVAE